MATRFVPVSPRFDPVFDISPGLSRCASVALSLSIAGSSLYAMDAQGSNATVLSRHVTVHPGYLDLSNWDAY